MSFGNVGTEILRDRKRDPLQTVRRSQVDTVDDLLVGIVEITVVIQVEPSIQEVPKGVGIPQIDIDAGGRRTVLADQQWGQERDTVFVVPNESRCVKHCGSRREGCAAFKEFHSNSAI